MMLLYVCPECGRWYDDSLTQAFQRSMEPFAKWSARVQGIDYKEPGQNNVCPDGHGAMVLVSPDMRLFVRQSVVESGIPEDRRRRREEIVEATSERMMVEYRDDLKYYLNRQRDILKVMSVLPGQYRYDQVDAAINASGVHPETVYRGLASGESTEVLALFYEALNGPR